MSILESTQFLLIRLICVSTFLSTKPITYFAGHKGLTFNWKENGLHYTDQNVLDLDADKKNILLEWKPEYNQLPDSVLVVDNNGAVTTRLDLI